MNMFTEWITRIVLFLLLAMVADALLPSGLMKKYARLVMSILLLLIFLGPLLQVLKVDPNQLIKSAEYSMDQQVDTLALDESIEKKKNEIVEGQDAYKLEQVTQALAKEMEEPLKQDLHLQLVNLDMSFLNKPYQMETLDKLVVTLTPVKEEAPVDEVNISIMDKPSSEDNKEDEEVRDWIADHLDLNKDQIEIRWEEEDE
ncbi:stage III sporulation protein AF [Halobacillus mangrovi]|uniref:Stage III sporulation protein AF n=2 Tax=Halobacillus mangrovi TaxID=402384 RepID=A0A1W6A108_9BACI|nr:stage III sporulation protein AF [Halobacillus mangrovi]